jgi:hypothetical protein
LRLVVPALGLLCLGAFTFLYRYQTDWYFRILTVAFAYPFDFPFIDGQVVMNWIRCWRRGVDVYVGDPCDVLDRALNYSPLWLRLSFLPTDKAWTNTVGLTRDGVFLISLAWLPQPRRMRDLGLVILATFSPVTVFGLERANADLDMFVLVVVAAVSLEHSFLWRTIGYAATMIAGLLKFYPFALLLLMLREGMLRFLVLAGATVAVIVGFGWYYHDELVRALANVPAGLYFSSGFGAVEFPGGLGEVLKTGLNALGLHGAFVDGLPENAILRTSVRLLLTAISVAFAIRLGGGAEVRSSLAVLPVRHANYAVIGAILISASFFAGHNTAYRAIYLLFTLPGFLLLAQSASLARVARWMVAAIIFAMWSPPLHHVSLYLARQHPDGSWAVAGRYVSWAVHELVWWWLATVLLAIVFAFVIESAAWRTTTGMFRRMRTGTAVP